MTIFVVFFLAAPETAVNAARNGLNLWFQKLLPTLLPFTILSGVVLRSNLINTSLSSGQTTVSSQNLRAILFIVFCGFLFGFPIGSKLSADLYEQKQISKKQAEILFAFTNNFSPVFVSLMLRTKLQVNNLFPWYFILYGIPLLYGIFCLMFTVRPKQAQLHTKTASRFEMNMQIIDAGIIHGFEALIKLCGYIILFSILSNLILLIPIQNTVLKILCIGITEVTNGMSQLGSNTTNQTWQKILTILFLSWGGISGYFQTASIVGHTDLSMKKYRLTRFAFVILSLTTGLLLIILRII